MRSPGGARRLRCPACGVRVATLRPVTPGGRVRPTLRAGGCRDRST
jgi:hypothetical protein